MKFEENVVSESKYQIDKKEDRDKVRCDYSHL